MRLLSIILISFFINLVLAQSSDDKPSQTLAQPSEEELRRQSFEKVWDTINKKHYDKTFGGVDWGKIREIYEPKALKAQNRAEFHKILNQMLEELKVSHVGVYDLKPADFELRAKTGIIGIEIKIIENKPVIWRVEKNSTADRAGLKPGFIIEKINDLSTRSVLERVESYFSSIRATDRIRLLYKEKVITTLIEGEPKTKLFLEVINSKNELQKVEVERYQANWQMSEPLGYFPPQPIIFEAYKIGDDIGYIRFNVWTIPQISRIRAAIQSLANAKGIIFDIRGNPGGISGMAAGIAGMLFKEPVSLGKMRGRELDLNLLVNPQPNPYLGKVIILMDYGTASTSEIFAIGLQENSRAVLIGETTAGMALPSIFETLPTGALFQYAIMDYISPKGTLVEGRGVKPDLEVSQRRQDLLEGRDLPLEIAIQNIIRNKN